MPSECLYLGNYPTYKKKDIKVILRQVNFSHTAKAPQIEMKPEQNRIVTTSLKTSEGISVAAKTCNIL